MSDGNGLVRRRNLLDRLQIIERQAHLWWDEAHAAGDLDEAVLWFTVARALEVLEHELELSIDEPPAR